MKGEEIFKNGFAWLSSQDGNYMCEILDHNKDYTLFTVSTGDSVILDVPLNALSPVNGDE